MATSIFYVVFGVLGLLSAIFSAVQFSDLL
jgi:hypothetical protein